MGFNHGGRIVVGLRVAALGGALIVAAWPAGAVPVMASEGTSVSAVGRYVTPPLREPQPRTVPAASDGTVMNEPSTEPEDPTVDPDLGTGAQEPRTAEEHINDRVSWLMKQRIYPFKTAPSGALQRARSQAARLPLATDRRQSISPNAVGQWQGIGPRPIRPVPYSNTFYNGVSPWSGRVTSLAAHPTNANIMYLGSAFGGIWKTTNGGTTWTPTFDQAGSLAIGSIAVSHSNPAVLYAGTGEGNGAVDSYLGNGVWKSTDSGGHWARVDGTRFNGCSIAKLVVNPTDPNVVLVAVRNGTAQIQQRACPNSAVGIWRTGNGGGSWSHVLTNVQATDLAESTAHPGTWYAGFEFGFVFKSTQGGAAGTWNQITTLPNPQSVNLGRTVLSTSPDGSRVVVGFENPSTSALYGNHFYRSTNGGGNWGTVPVASNFCKIGASGQCFYDFALQIDPTAPTRFYALGIYAFRCTTTCTAIGSSGTPPNTPASIHVDFHAVSVDASGRLWIGSDGGVYRSGNNGGSFTNLNAGLSITQFYPGVSGKPAAALVGGTQDNGSLRRDANDGAWREISEGDGGYTATDPANPKHQYVTYPGGVVYETLNAGTTRPGQIDNFGSGRNICSYLNGDQCNFIFPLIGDPAGARSLFAGSRKMWHASFASSQWTWHYSASTFDTPVMAIGAVKRTGKATVVYAATTGDGSHQPQVRVSTDGGNNFGAAGTGLPNRFVTDFVIDPANWKRAWATVSGFGTDHIYRTTNGGQSWTSVDGNFPNTPVSAIAVDFRGATPVLYAGADVGVFRSVNGGATWARFGSGLPNSIVMDIVLYPTSNTLLAATHGRGAFLTTIAAP